MASSCTKKRLLADFNERIRSVETGPDGFLYAITDSSNGKIIRIRPGQPAGEELGPRVSTIQYARGCRSGGHPETARRYAE